MRHLSLVLLPLALLACNADPDEDGLSNSEEKDLGTDPEVPDSDGDGLMDGEEVELGTNPMSLDSDGDSYQDNWEIAEGTDPTDAASMIYTGGWRYNPDKEEWGEPTSPRAASGAEVPRFQLQDQHGDTFDIYDFAGDGAPILLDVSGIWCGWCHELAKRIERKPNALDSYKELDCLPDAVENGDILWVTAVYSDTSGRCGSGTPEAVATWYATHPAPQIPVLADQDCAINNWVAPGGYPAVIHIDSATMKVVTPSGNYVGMIGGVCSSL
jgi:hypothetical protein